ncbi:MAG: RES domain-containing protein [Proteobacteria bacterium]|nr:RES domain-containing protein [Pseudomonadota bacterium]
MPVAHRIVKARHASAAFSGEGARVVGGRWNRPGDAVVYASASLALAAMETFIHLGEDGLHISFVSFRIEIPDTVQAQSCRRPPAGWRDEPPQETSMRYGSAWLRSGGTAVLEVPSAIVPSESNYLLNPLHPDFGRIRIGRARPFTFDPRMWK